MVAYTGPSAMTQADYEPFFAMLNLRNQAESEFFAQLPQISPAELQMLMPEGMVRSRQHTAEAALQALCALPQLPDLQQEWQDADDDQGLSTESGHWEDWPRGAAGAAAEVEGGVEVLALGCATTVSILDAPSQIQVDNFCPEPESELEGEGVCTAVTKQQAAHGCRQPDSQPQGPERACDGKASWCGVDGGEAAAAGSGGTQGATPGAAGAVPGAATCVGDAGCVAGTRPMGKRAGTASKAAAQSKAAAVSPAAGVTARTGSLGEMQVMQALLPPRALRGRPAAGSLGTPCCLQHHGSQGSSSRLAGEAVGGERAPRSGSAVLGGPQEAQVLQQGLEGNQGGASQAGQGQEDEPSPCSQPEPGPPCRTQQQQGPADSLAPLPGYVSGGPEQLPGSLDDVQGGEGPDCNEGLRALPALGRSGFKSLGEQGGGKEEGGLPPAVTTDVMAGTRSSGAGMAGAGVVGPGAARAGVAEAGSLPAGVGGLEEGLPPPLRGCGAVAMVGQQLDAASMPASAAITSQPGLLAEGAGMGQGENRQGQLDFSLGKHAPPAAAAAAPAAAHDGGHGCGADLEVERGQLGCDAVQAFSLDPDFDYDHAPLTPREWPYNRLPTRHPPGPSRQR
ncbi:hypothetical protein V8C86DRAFT_780149 [Haematococcus lacustris]